MNKTYQEIKADKCKFCNIDLGCTAVKVRIEPSILHTPKTSFQVSCFKCGTAAPRRPTRNRAIIVWNNIMRSK